MIDGKMKRAGICLAMAALTIVQGLGEPRITKQPLPATNSVSVGGSLTARVTATTTVPPLNYQWQFEGSNLPGKTNVSLVLTNMQAAQAGNYRVVVGDAAGSVTSDPWRVEIDPAFVVVNGSPVSTPTAGRGAAFGDWNRDGWLDLFVGTAGAHYLFTNRKDGTFARVSMAPLSADSGGNGAAWGDYDNDGWLDLVVPRNNNLLLYRNLGNGTFSKITTNTIGKASGNFWTASWSDYDRDGKLDLFVANGFTRGVNALFHNDGEGAFSRVTNIVTRDVAEFSNSGTWADYDNDGSPDLYVANSRDFDNGGAFRPSFLYHNKGDGGFEKITNSVVTRGTGKGGMAHGAWGDYDNDGWLDLFMCGYGTSSGAQQHQLFHNDGGGNFSLAAQAGEITTDFSNAQGAGWADYDNDGWLDLFVTAGGPNAGFRDYLYRNNGDGTFARVQTGSPANDNGEGAGCVWGDVNNDGFLDLYVSNFQAQTPERNALYLNAGNSNGWLVVKLEGRSSNRGGVGAKVRVKATIGGQARWQMREISASSGYLSQHATDAGFGLGDATRAELVRVEWPSGIVQELRDVTGKQILRVQEPNRIEALRAVDGQSFSLLVHGSPNKEMEIQSSVDLREWNPLGTVSNAIPSAVVADPGPVLPGKFYRVLER